MKSLVSLFLIFFSTLALSQTGPVVGKFDIESAKCDGEQFLWKKHDQMIVSQKVMAFEGKLVEKSSDETLCRFQDVFRLGEDSTFEGDSRNIICWSLEGENKVGNPSVEVETVIGQTLKVEKENTNSGARIKLIGMELCEGELELELSYHVN